jgi:hypothetical protein
MIGGAPMMLSGFDSSFPGVQSTTPIYGSPFPSRPATGYGMPPASQPARPALVQQQPPAPRVVRGQRPDDQISPIPPAPTLRPVPLRMPSPEELGVADAKRLENPSIDWSAVHNQLDRLGATCFHLERLPEGGCRITCLLPTNQQGRTHRIEAASSTEAEALRLTFAKAQEWARER